MIRLLVYVSGGYLGYRVFLRGDTLETALRRGTDKVKSLFGRGADRLAREIESEVASPTVVPPSLAAEMSSSTLSGVGHARPLFGPRVSIVAS